MSYSHESNDSENSAPKSRGNGPTSRAEGKPREQGRNFHGRHHRRHRKERVLHTRISEQLSEDIRSMADDLRVPVSNLVRNVLEEAFSVVEQVSGDMGDLVDDVIDQAERASDGLRRYRDRRRQREDRVRRHMEAREQARRGEEQVDASPQAQPSAEPRSESASEHEPEPESGAGSEPGLAEAFPDVVAWQRVVLNQSRRCARSGEALPAGSVAYLGFGAQGPTDAVLSQEAFQASGSAAR